MCVRVCYTFVQYSTYLNVGASSKREKMENGMQNATRKKSQSGEHSTHMFPNSNITVSLYLVRDRVIPHSKRVHARLKETARSDCVKSHCL